MTVSVNIMILLYHTPLRNSPRIITLSSFIRRTTLIKNIAFSTPTSGDRFRVNQINLWHWQLIHDEIISPWAVLSREFIMYENETYNK